MPGEHGAHSFFNPVARESIGCATSLLLPDGNVSWDGWWISCGSGAGFVEFDDVNDRALTHCVTSG